MHVHTSEEGLLYKNYGLKAKIWVDTTGIKYFCGVLVCLGSPTPPLSHQYVAQPQHIISNQINHTTNNKPANHVLEGMYMTCSDDASEVIRI